MGRKVEILDTTLREGEQCFGVFFPIAVKKRIALLLDRIGVDFIEVGHPAAAPSICQAVSEIVDLRLNSRLIAHARLNEDEIRIVSDLGLDWVGLFCGINGHARRRYGLSRQEIFRKAADAVIFAKGLGLSVKFTCEDASRTAPKDLSSFYQHLLDTGVHRLGFADTVGTLTPAQLRSTCNSLKTQISLDNVHFHLHDDSGLAWPNALEAVNQGAGCIDASIMGIGERMGIAPLEKALAALKETSQEKLNLAARAGSLVASCIDPERFSLRRFAHKSGIHINGILKDAAMYEGVEPQTEGGRRILVLSKLIGWSGVQQLLHAHGFRTDCLTTEFVLQRIKNEELLELSGQEEIEAYFSRNGAQKAPGVSTGDRAPAAFTTKWKQQRRCSGHRPA